MPSQIQDIPLWWEGPEFLQDRVNWPDSKFNIDLTDLPELRTKTFTVTKGTEGFPFTRFSSFIRLKRTVAYILRFKHNCLYPDNRYSGPLTVTEINTAFISLIKISQRESFPLDYKALSNNGNIQKNSRILSLSPFMDTKGIIRVGGRLNNSKFDYNKKHPILISPQHHMTRLIFRYEHLRLYHVGPQALLASIREQYWPVSGRNLAKKIVRECICCSRYKPVNQNPIMGHLPFMRVQPGFPFEVVGVDYAGPVSIKNHKGRGAKSSKCWICLFICMKTRAVHLELETELSTNSFILALRRFVSRRGRPTHIYSDHGSNFVGAWRELGQFLRSKEFINQIQSQLASENINWHFIPVKSPHMGGNWENGVKSCKHHLRRVMGNIIFTFEELYTLLVQIESILNSRPLCPMSTDPNDLSPLTPSHFLIGRPSTSLPEPDLRDVNINRLTRFQLIQRIQQHFWQRWQKEYISQFQQRTKWKENKFSLELNDLVFVKDDNLPPKHWMLGRICKLYPGRDGVTRVADVKTSNGIIRRAFSKLCVLPMCQD